MWQEEDISDDGLVSRYLAGDMAAFEALYRRYNRRLLGFIVSLGGSWEQSQDVAQKAWLKALGRLDGYECRGLFRQWLFRIGHRLWLDEVRGAWERRRVAVGQGNEEDFAGLPLAHEAYAAEDTGASAIEKEQRDLLYLALEELPDAMRQTILLRIDAGMSFKEIAEAMGCPLGTALWRGREAQRRLTGRLGGQE